MIVGLLTIPMHLQGIDSLKGKRRIVKSVIERLRSRFNVSIAEIGSQDNKRLAIVGIAVISNEGAYLDEQLDKIIQFVVNDGRFYVGQIGREIFSADPPSA
jgi:hypothetical protein